MDYKIEMVDGRPQMRFEKTGGNNLLNNIILSLFIRRGDWWFDPAFGSRLHLLKKNSPKAPDLAEEYCKEALKWILDAGKAVRIDVRAWRDETNRNRLNLYIEAEGADGKETTFSTYKELI